MCIWRHLVNGTGNSPSLGPPNPGVVKQDKSSRSSVDTTKTRSDPQRVRMSSGERPIGATKCKQTNAMALCQTPRFGFRRAGSPPLACLLNPPPSPPDPTGDSQPSHPRVEGSLLKRRSRRIHGTHREAFIFVGHFCVSPIILKYSEVCVMRVALFCYFRKKSASRPRCGPISSPPHTLRQQSTQASCQTPPQGCVGRRRAQSGVVRSVQEGGWREPPKRSGAFTLSYRFGADSQGRGGGVAGSTHGGAIASPPQPSWYQLCPAGMGRDCGNLDHQ